MQRPWFHFLSVLSLFFSPPIICASSLLLPCNWSRWWMHSWIVLRMMDKPGIANLDTKFLETNSSSDVIGPDMFSCLHRYLAKIHLYFFAAQSHLHHLRKYFFHNNSHLYCFPKLEHNLFLIHHFVVVINISFRWSVSRLSDSNINFLACSAVNLCKFNLL